MSRGPIVTMQVVWTYPMYGKGVVYCVQVKFWQKNFNRSFYDCRFLPLKNLLDFLAWLLTMENIFWLIFWPWTKIEVSSIVECHPLAMGFGANSYVIVLSYKYIVSHSQTSLMHAKAQRVIVIVIFFTGSPLMISKNWFSVETLHIHTNIHTTQK